MQCCVDQLFCSVFSMQNHAFFDRAMFFFRIPIVLQFSCNEDSHMFFDNTVFLFLRLIILQADHSEDLNFLQ